MLDGVVRKIIDPSLNAAGRAVARSGVSANQITLAGLAIGLLGALAIALQWYGLGLALIVVSRLADGLDGAVARATVKTDFGGYLDIVCDFLFYGAVPMAFVIADPAANAIAGAVLLCSFYFNGSTFLGYAILAEKHQLTTEDRGIKTLYFTDGLLEGTETIGFFLAIAIWPQAFPVLAYLFAAGCFFTATARTVRAWKLFGMR